MICDSKQKHDMRKVWLFNFFFCFVYVKFSNAEESLYQKKKNFLEETKINIKKRLKGKKNEILNTNKTHTIKTKK